MLHTSPSSLHPSKNLGYWKTIDDDYHWHIEIMPVVPSKAKSYTFKEVYYFSGYVRNCRKAVARGQNQRRLSTCTRISTRRGM